MGTKTMMMTTTTKMRMMLTIRFVRWVVVAQATGAC